MVNVLRASLVMTLLAAAGCLSSASNDYLFSCANGGNCPGGTQCASDSLCHPVFTPGAGPSDAGSYICASASPQCPDGQVCSAGLCVAADAGGTQDAGDGGETPDAGDAGGQPDAGDAGEVPDAGPDAGADAGTDAGAPCDLAKAFSGPNAYACGAYCMGLAIADFNRDGFSDIAVAISDPTGPQAGVALFLNAGDGTVSNAIPSLGQFPCGGDISNAFDFVPPDALAVADFNGDGWPDLGLSITQASTLAIALNGQDGGFVFGTPQPATSPGCPGASGFPYSTVVAFQPQGSDWYLASVGFGVNDSDDNSVVAFSHVQSNSLGLDPWTTLLPASGLIPGGLVIGHVGPGAGPNLALAESDFSGSDEVEIYPPSTQGPPGTFASTPSATLASHGGTSNIAMADLDGDGLDDLVTVNNGNGSISVFYAKSGGFKTAVSFSTLIGDAGSAPETLVIADLDHDGRSDIATVNGSGNVTLLKGMPDGGFLAVGALFSNLTVPGWIAAADLETRNANDGGIPDLVISSVVDFNGSSVEVFQNNCR